MADRSKSTCGRFRISSAATTASMMVGPSKANARGGSVGEHVDRERGGSPREECCRQAHGSGCRGRTLATAQNDADVLRGLGTCRQPNSSRCGASCAAKTRRQRRVSAGAGSAQGYGSVRRVLINACVDVADNALDVGASFVEGHELDAERARRTPPGYVGVMLSPKEVEQLLDRIERGDGKRG